MYVVMAQYNYVKDKDMGYNPQRVAVGNAYFGSEEESGPALQFFPWSALCRRSFFRGQYPYLEL